MCAIVCEFICAINQSLRIVVICGVVVINAVVLRDVVAAVVALRLLVIGLLCLLLSVCLS